MSHRFCEILCNTMSHYVTITKYDIQLIIHLLRHLLFSLHWVNKLVLVYNSKITFLHCSIDSLVVSMLEMMSRFIWNKRWGHETLGETTS